MRIIALGCLLALAACYGNPDGGRNWAVNHGLEDVTRVESFKPTGPGSFIYSAQTNTVMTENDDGTAERIRRQWLAEALRAHGMCPLGYIIDNRAFVQNEQHRFANGGDIVYTGRCLSPAPPPPPPPRPFLPRERG